MQGPHYLQLSGFEPFKINENFVSYSFRTESAGYGFTSI